MEIAILGFSIWFLVKIFFLIALVIYVIFAFVVLKQVTLMAETVDLGFDSEVRGIALVHLIFAIGTFILALILL